MSHNSTSRKGSRKSYATDVEKVDSNESGDIACNALVPNSVAKSKTNQNPSSKRVNR